MLSTLLLAVAVSKLCICNGNRMFHFALFYSDGLPLFFPTWHRALGTGTTTRSLAERACGLRVTSHKVFLKARPSSLGSPALLPPSLVPLGSDLMSLWPQVSLLEIRDNQNTSRWTMNLHKALRYSLAPVPS